MPRRQRRMIEIAHRLPRHPELPCNTLRSLVGSSRPRKDLAEPHPAEPIDQYRSGRFRDMAMPPRCAGLAPYDLDTRRHRMLVTNFTRQPAEPDQRAIRTTLDRPHTETVRVEMRFEACDGGLRLIEGHRATRQPRGHIGIGVHRSQRTGIARSPATQRQTFGLDLQWRINRDRNVQKAWGASGRTHTVLVTQERARRRSGGTKQSRSSPAPATSGDGHENQRRELNTAGRIVPPGVHRMSATPDQASTRRTRLLVLFEVVKKPFLTILRRQTYAETYARSHRNSSEN